MDITDAKTNLSDSFYYACDDASQGVQIVFDGKVIAGTRAKKVRTKSYNAFSSIDFPYLAVIQDRRILRYLPMLPYESLDEVISFVRARPRPLAFYIFTASKETERKLLDSCFFGGGCINDTIIHLATSHMPFGGVGDSAWAATTAKRASIPSPTSAAS